MSRPMTTLDCYRLGAVNVSALDDDTCYECQGTGEVEGEAVNRNGAYTIIMECRACGGTGKVEGDELE